MVIASGCCPKFAYSAHYPLFDTCNYRQKGQCSKFLAYPRTGKQVQDVGQLHAEKMVEGVVVLKDKSIRVRKKTKLLVSQL